MIHQCLNPKCGAIFQPKRKRHTYCCRKCSVYVRNWRYYETLKGRFKKRAAARLYFQRHSQEIYKKRAARMERYVADILAKGSADPEITYFMHGNRKKPLSVEEATLMEARRIARVQHDWHPRQQ